MINTATELSNDLIALLSPNEQRSTNGYTHAHLPPSNRALAGRGRYGYLTGNEAGNNRKRTGKTNGIATELLSARIFFYSGA